LQIIKGFDKQSNYIFAVAMFIHAFIMCVEFGAWSVPYRGRLLQLAFVLCCIKILMTFYEKYEWIVMIILGIIGCLSYYFSKEKYVLYVVVMIFAAKSVNIKKMARILAVMVAVSLVIIPVLSFAGVGDLVSETRDFGRNVVETRYGLGFGHPNGLHGTIWYLVSLIIILFRDKLDWKIYSALTAANVFFFMLTASKAGFGVVQLMIIAGLAYKYFNRFFFEKIWIYILGMLSFAAVIILTLISVTTDCWADYGPVLKKLDSITTGRLNIAYQMAYLGDWKLFEGIGPRKDIVDNGFAAIGADYGYVVWLLYIVFIIGLIAITAKRKEGILFSVIMTCIIYTFMEKTYVLNDAYMLSNLSYIVMMFVLGREGVTCYENSNVGT